MNSSQQTGAVKRVKSDVQARRRKSEKGEGGEGDDEEDGRDPATTLQAMAGIVLCWSPRYSQIFPQAFKL